MNRLDSSDAIPFADAEVRTGGIPARLKWQRDWRLIAARVAWVVALVWILGSFAWSLPHQLVVFQHPSARSTELAPAAIAALRQVGISVGVYAWVAVISGSVVMLVATALALILFWRRGDDWMALLVALLFPAYCLQSIGPSETFTAAPSGSPLQVANTIALAIVTFAIIFAVFMLFPSGRFAPAWSWILLVGFVLWIAARAARPELGILFLGYPVFLGAAVACQIYRFRAVSTPVQRQQSRWAVFGLVTALLANQAFWGLTSLTPLGHTIFPPIGYLVVYGSVLLIPTTFFIAILRHRLYEIDLIIRRTLVYGTLTAILAGVYFGIVLGAQLVTRRLTGATGQQPVIIVATTLLIAALVSPLRRSLQAGIDRAFYRSKYDARLTLARFASQLRMEADLEEVNGRLVDIVQQTMRPTHTTLWLRTPPTRNTGTSTGERPPPR